MTLEQEITALRSGAWPNPSLGVRCSARSGGTWRLRTAPSARWPPTCRASGRPKPSWPPGASGWRRRAAPTWRRSWETCCDGGHPPQGVAHPVPLAGGRGGDRGQPGARSGEFAGLKLADVDFDPDVLLVLGKGRRGRALPFGRKATLALDRTGGLASVTRRHRWTGYGSARRGADGFGAGADAGTPRPPGRSPPICTLTGCGTRSCTSGSRKAVAKRT